jgi:oligopeptidase B
MIEPIAEKEIHKVKFGNVNKDRGDNLIDPPIELDDYYFWMRDDSRKNTRVIEHLKNENKYTETKMNDTKDLINTLYDEIKSFVKETNDSYPLPHGDGGWDSKYYYFVRTIEGKSFPIHCRINKLNNNQEEILLDENLLAEGKENFDLKSFSITKDHKIMSYGIDLSGNEKYDLKIINIDTNEEINHDIPELSYCIYFWCKEFIYYTMGNETNRMYQIWKYNTITRENMKIYQNDDDIIDIGLHQSMDEKYFFISASSYSTSDIYYFTEDDLEIKQFTKRIDNHKYSVDHHEGNFLITTNKDNSRNFKIMKTNLNETSIENWKEFIPYDQSIYILGIFELKNYLLLSFKNNGDNFYKVIPFRDGQYDFNNSHVIDIKDEIKNIGLVGLDIYDTDHVIYTHNSLNTPSTIYKYNLITKETKLLRQKEVPNYNKTLYETKRIFINSHDGVKIPISLVYKKELFNHDGTNPVYLYGYGSYGITVDPDFDSSIIPLLDRGFIYVIAHVRGGSFLGEDWYEDGKMGKKKNTFFDFISCAEYLITNNYTNEKGITIEGRSAGGLLVGASMVMRPELFRTVIAGVPFVDVMNTMSDPDIPLTTPEWEQWGNPNQQEHFDKMIEYCPYYNIKTDVYPNVLALGGLNDPRVAYWEPAKFIAKLREHNTGDNLLLLKVELNEGHFGVMDRYKYWKETAFKYAYILKTYNLLN